MNLPHLESCTVAVIGLGYVGLPLAVEFAKPQTCVRTGAQLRRRVIGFDINHQRLDELRLGIDRTKETSAEELASADFLELSEDPALLAHADVFLVTVPTPIDCSKRPDLTPLEKASITVGRALKQRLTINERSLDIPLVIYESTVYPGATEEVCVPILELESGLRFNEGFACGYSPERINPGDNEHRLAMIKKVTSGSTYKVAQWIDAFYGSIIKAGTYQASSLKVAEAAKVIENTQRDLNIALINELAIIFRRMDIDTLDVLDAAGTKWNFLPFRPGLVGGHCIGVDPYYLTYKAEQLGYHPQVVLAGRRINDGMACWIVEQLVLEMARRGFVIADARVLVLGVSFKENCPDLRNSKVLELVNSLEQYKCQIVISDPWVDQGQAMLEHGICVSNSIPVDQLYDVVILAVAHSQFIELSLGDLQKLATADGIFVDIKGALPRSLGAIRL